MRIHVVSTINGMHNEGMRNVATYLSKEFEKENTVTYSPLKDIFGIIRNGRKADCVLLFARLIKPVYFMLRFIRPFVKNICVVCVQPVTEEFSELNKKHRVVDYCLAISKDDVKFAFDDNIIHTIDVGIDASKFQNRNISKQELCKKLDLPDDKLIALHVGHCSVGRGLEDMLRLDFERYYPIVVASGMFDNESTIDTLRKGGVDVRFGYVENIEDYYNCADVYFFPTKSNEFVISVPLSVMEALSCGTAVVAYNSFDGLSLISASDDNALVLIDSPDEISSAVDRAVRYKSDSSYLDNPQSWQQVSKQITDYLENKVE